MVDELKVLAIIISNITDTIILFVGDEFVVLGDSLSFLVFKPLNGFIHSIG